MGKKTANVQMPISEEQYALLQQALLARQQLDQRIGLMVGTIMAGRGVAQGLFIGIEGKPKHRVLLYREV